MRVNSRGERAFGSKRLSLTSSPGTGPHRYLKLRRFKLQFLFLSRRPPQGLADRLGEYPSRLRDEVGPRQEEKPAT